jgi:hypothetical protein
MMLNALRQEQKKSAAFWLSHRAFQRQLPALVMNLVDQI